MSARSEVEKRLNLSPIEALLAKRSELVEQVAVLRARHGSFGTRDAERKIKLCTIKMTVRARLVANGAKATDAAVDDMAHSDPAYMEWVTNATREASELQVLEDRIDYINDLIRRDQSLASFLTQEARLG